MMPGVLVFASANNTVKDDKNLSPQQLKALKKLEKTKVSNTGIDEFIRSDEFSLEKSRECETQEGLLRSFNTALTATQVNSANLSKKAYPELLEKFAKLGKTEEDLNKTLEYCSTAPLMINVRGKDITAISKSRHYRAHTAMADIKRIPTEQNMFPGTYIYNYINTRPHMGIDGYRRFHGVGPIYGSLNVFKSRQGITLYGNIILILQDHIRKYITLSHRDSFDFNENIDTLGTLNHLCDLLNRLDDEQLEKITDAALSNRLNRPEEVRSHEIIEAQIHIDKLSLETDIKKIVLRRDGNYNPEELRQCLELAETYSIPLVWHGAVATDDDIITISKLCQQNKWAPATWTKADGRNYLTFKKSPMIDHTSFEEAIVDFKNLPAYISSLQKTKTSPKISKSPESNTEFFETSISGLHINSKGECSITHNFVPTQSTGLSNQENYYFKVHTCKDIQQFLQDTKNSKISIQAHAFHQGLYYVITKRDAESGRDINYQFQEISNAASFDAAVSHVKKNFGQIVSTSIDGENKYSFIYTLNEAPQKTAKA